MEPNASITMKPSSTFHRFGVPKSEFPAPPSMPRNVSAFTRIELLAVMVALGLLAATVLPLLAGNKRVSDRVVCVSNLERIGQATHAWMGDHGDERFPYYVSMSDGGLSGHPLRQNAYLGFVVLSNYLDTPRHLACPADETTFAAPNWAQFDSPPYRANALSYFIGTDASSLDRPKVLIAGDRHFLNAVAQNCGNINVRAVTLPSKLYNAAVNAALTWNSQAIHGESGNILFADGQVVQASSAGLRTLVNDQLFGTLNGANHVLPPR
jgi:prepilin-type processing-associated H-X9-DG protein